MPLAATPAGSGSRVISSASTSSYPTGQTALDERHCLREYLPPVSTPDQSPASFERFRFAVQKLSCGSVSPQPEEEAWAGTIDRISVSGRIAEITEDTYWHFLEVLPPRFLRGNVFAFAEGMEPLRLFWEHDSRYFCRKLTWDETKELCAAAGIAQDYWAR